jgi:hypothetical protein
MATMERTAGNVIPVTIANSVTAATRIPVGSFAGGCLETPSSLGSHTSFALYAARTESSTPVVVRDQFGTAVTLTTVTASNMHELPSCVFAFPYIMIIGNHGTALTGCFFVGKS